MEHICLPNYNRKSFLCLLLQDFALQNIFFICPATVLHFYKELKETKKEKK